MSDHKNIFDIALYMKDNFIPLYQKYNGDLDQMSENSYMKLHTAIIFNDRPTEELVELYRNHERTKRDVLEIKKEVEQLYKIINPYGQFSKSWYVDFEKVFEKVKKDHTTFCLTTQKDLPHRDPDHL